MLECLRETLVKTYIGAIALGYLLAHCVLQFAGIFTTPVGKWITRREYGDLLQHPPSSGLYWLDAGSEAVGFLVLLLVWYLLVRWLYYKPITAPSE